MDTQADETAYPLSTQPFIYTLPDGSKRIDSGLTKREYFSAIAMQGMLAGNLNTKDTYQTAEMAVKQADALINALNTKQ